MSKSVKVVVPNVEFATDDIRKIVFRANKKQVKVTCKGKPVLLVSSLGRYTTVAPKARGKEGVFVCRAKGSESNAYGRTPQEAYANGVAQFWQ